MFAVAHTKKTISTSLRLAKVAILHVWPCTYILETCVFERIRHERLLIMVQLSPMIECIISWFRWFVAVVSLCVVRNFHVHQNVFCVPDWLHLSCIYKYHKRHAGAVQGSAQTTRFGTRNVSYCKELFRFGQCFFSTFLIDYGLEMVKKLILSFPNVTAGILAHSRTMAFFS